MLLEEIKESILTYINGFGYKPIKSSELMLELFPEGTDEEKFTTAVNEMLQNGDIFMNKKGKIATLSHFNMVKGIFQSTKRGFGFVESELMKEDVFIKSDDRNSAFNGDTVIAKITDVGSLNRRPEGVIVKILNRANSQVVGTFIENKSFAFIIPDNKKFDQDVFIAKKYFSGAKNNDKVVCEVIQWPENNLKPEGKVIEILGQKGERYVEIDSIVRAHNLPDEFPSKVQDYVSKLPQEVTKEDLQGREDYRDRLIYTIDGDDSKDFDDAVEVDILENGNYRLGVHIADVTNYVKENSVLDKEALKRATSVYLVDKVIPMLPKELSNGICSLNPNVDRLTLSCIMEINPKNGKVEKYDIKKSVINSKARMTYHKVSEILENEDKELCEEYKDFLDSFRNAEKLAEILREKRKRRGAIEFEFPESYIQLDEKGIPVDIKAYEIRVSNKMIEEFMLEANETIAQHYFWLKLPFVYRIHEQPSEEKMQTLREFIHEMGYTMHQARGDVRPSDLQKVLNTIETKEEKKSIGTIMLRSLRQAKYSPECLGHFGLAASYYCHFTSPIRRYPDLQIHRIIKENLDGKLNSKRISHFEKVVPDVSVRSSVQERNADLAERDVDDYYKSVYMEDKIGEIFEGTVSSVTSFGMFVELDNGIEGLVRLETLDRPYVYIEKSQCLRSYDSSKIYRLGQKVKVEVDDVKVDLKEIDFIVVK